MRYAYLGEVDEWEAINDLYLDLRDLAYRARYEQKLAQQRLVTALRTGVDVDRCRCERDYRWEQRRLLEQKLHHAQEVRALSLKMQSQQRRRGGMPGRQGPTRYREPQGGIKTPEMSSDGTCPRCSGQVRYSHGEAACLMCGWVRYDQPSDVLRQAPWPPQGHLPEAWG